MKRSASPAAVLLLMLNLFLYLVVVGIAAWAVNHEINQSLEAASKLTPSSTTRMYPIYFQNTGKKATGFFVIASLLAGVVGVTTSVVGVYNMRAQVNGRRPDLYTISAFSLLSWVLTVLALGFGSKEIISGYCGSSLRIMEAVVIVLCMTQLLCTVAIHRGTINF